MTNTEHRTSVGSETTLPKGIPHIIGNEAAERFSFYGMKAVLVVFMTSYLHLMGKTAGQPMSEQLATANYHFFGSWVYYTPLLGALLSDFFFGKYRTIISLSLVYVLGHAVLALMGVTGDAATWMYMGLALVALGAGGIKPCVSAHVGDQFGKGNSHLLTQVFNWFYFSINVGAAVSSVLTPWLLKWYGPHFAFGVPGVLMALATLIFWLGRKRFVHIPARGMAAVQELFSPAGFGAILRVIPLFLFVAVFWALFDQTGSTWVFQAQDMNRQFLGMEWLPSQIQSLNPVFILTFIPLFTYFVYPAISKVWPLTPLRKIGLGLFLMVLAFVIVAVIQSIIDKGGQPSIVWQFLAYLLLTASEVMVSIVALEFAYTQAPRSLKSIVMSLFLVSVALGNSFTALFNLAIQIEAPFAKVSKISAKSARANLEIGDITHVGWDGESDTEDDLVWKDGEIDSIVGEELKALSLLVKAEDGFLPAFLDLEQQQDPWGSPYHYERLNRTTARLYSPGPDRKARTKWDLGVNLVLSDEKEKKKLFSFITPKQTWLERREEELAKAAKVAADSEGEPAAKGEKDAISRTLYAGGGSRLEGAGYFWFFAGLMLLAALIFIPYARCYRGEVVLQE